MQALGKQAWNQQIRENLICFEVLGKVLEEFWGYFPLFYAILRYFPGILRYFTLYYAILP